MASKKDLIEAQGFSRRRLLTAFTAGAPGGKELEPAKPMRAVAAGIALALLVVVVGIFSGLFKPGLPDGWEDNKLILISDTGARYFTSDGKLYPVLNATSAMLLAPGGSLSVTTTDSGSIADIPVGASIGIVGAPDAVPDPANLINDGWVACPVGDGTAFELAGAATPTPASAGTVVTSDDVTYVVSGGYRYPVSPDAPDNAASVLRAVGLSEAVPTDVDSRWLNLFASGSDLAPIVVPNADTPVAGSDLRVGQVVIEGANSSKFLVTEDGELQQLSPLAYELYLLGTGSLVGAATEVEAGATQGLGNAPEPTYGADWPTAALTPVASADQICALLDRAPTGDAQTVLATSDVVVDKPGVVVPPRSGALVLSGGQGDESVGEVVLVDESGVSYAIPGADDSLLASLGYTAEDVGDVHAEWMQFFVQGPELTVKGAGSTATGASIVSPSAASPATASASPEPSLAADAADEVQRCEPGTYLPIAEPPAPLAMLQNADATSVATGDGVLVAVVDSGIDASNAHLAGAVVDGVDFVGDGEDSTGRTDLSGHGTAIAGAIAARAVEGSGVIGQAPQAQLLSVRVYRADDDQSKEDGFGPRPDRLAQGIRWAVDRGAKVINVSLSNTTDDSAVRAAVDYADANGALVVASAGNKATSDAAADLPRFPAAYPAALSVTAVNRDALPTDDSIHGSHVEVAAPGQDVATAMTGGLDCLYGSQAPSSSFATAYAAGAAALIAQAHPLETPQQWQYRLMASATRGNPDSRDDLEGWGVIQPYDALVMVPGSGERGPDNPFTGASALTVDAPTVGLVPRTVESPFELTRSMAVTAMVGAAVVLGSLGTLLVYRRRSDAVAVPAEQPDGLLDKMRGENTRIL